MNTKRLYLDPDYRKQPDTSKPYCIRCQKVVNPKTAIKVSMIGEWNVIQDDNGIHLVGSDCWKKISSK